MLLSNPRSHPALVRTAALLSCMGFSGLAGCVDTVGSINAAGPAETSTAPTRLAARPGVSPRPATIAFASFDGLPGSLAARFTSALQSQAAARDIVVTDAGSARYVVRGYLGVRPAQTGAEIGYVWDVFDAEHHRAQRMEDRIGLDGVSPDLWNRVDDKVLQALAQRSADDMAAFLTNTPEAIAAASDGANRVATAPDAGSATSASAASARPALAYAPD